MDDRKVECDELDYLDRVYCRRKELRDLYISYIDNAGLSAEDRRFMPAVKYVTTTPAGMRLTEEGDAQEKITRELWQEALDRELLEFFENFRLRAKESIECAIEIQRNAMLENIGTSRPAWFDVAYEGMTIDGPTTFMSLHFSARSIMSVSKYMMGRRQTMYRPERAYTMRHSTFEDEIKHAGKWFSHEHALTAGAILYSMGGRHGGGLPTMIEWEDMGEVFVCMSCLPENRRKCSWSGLVCSNSGLVEYYPLQHVHH